MASINSDPHSNTSLATKKTYNGRYNPGKADCRISASIPPNRAASHRFNCHSASEICGDTCSVVQLLTEC
ncbi:hypothetical protein ACN38_g7740 [Penicillium nordicum]|uniref:Uncharacterized protein n=1 Tax=Penicillium nordicum TaxID=229535 RepID=A0A0M9WE49_9EURO|nr:hypothetical protein ACN38_g7740 [Penicillium nordicum]